MADITFRTATEDDAGRLLEIYAYYVEQTAITFEWTVPTLEEFAGRMRRTLEKYPYIVAEEGGRIVGYAYAGSFVGREAYSWSVETTIYLDAAERHHGAGKKLYLALEETLRRMGIINLNACIGYPCGADDEHLTRNSAQFHEHLGYRLVGEFHRCGYKFGRWYDMVWMEKMLGDHPDAPEPVLPFPAIRESLVGDVLTA